MQLGPLRDDIASLTQIFGPSGHEDLVIAEFTARVRKEGFIPEVDRLGNVLVRARIAQPGWPTVAVAAHLDEVGVVVSDVGDGWVRVNGVGGIHGGVMAGQLLQFRTDSGELVEGCVSIDSAHLSSGDDQRAVAKMDELCVDLLMSSAPEAEQLGIVPGTPGVFVGPFAQRGHLVRAKALDDRIGIAVILALVRGVRALPEGPGLTVIATVQEEFTVRAGVVAAGAAAPDVLLCVDISPVRSVADRARPVLGAGPVLHRYSRGKSGSGLIPNPRLASFVTQVAAAQGIPLARRALDGGLSDASYMQFAAGGIACVDLAFPVRNAHTAVEVAHLGDVAMLIELLNHVLADMPSDPGFGRG